MDGTATGPKRQQHQAPMELMEEKELDRRQLLSLARETEAPPLRATSGCHMFILCLLTISK